jgi:hypothetical protein
VVPVEGESPLAQAAGAPVLEIQLGADQLPQIDEIDLWAHVQLPADPQATPEQLLATAPDRALARVISPRALVPRKQYLACVVPTFEAGRLAGLGQPVPDPRSADPAWGSVAVTLPVLDSWTFSTTDAGDFETLARRLKPRDLAAASRPWPIDVFRISGEADGRVVPFETALVPAGWSDPWHGSARGIAANRLRTWLQRVADASAEVPAVGPPLYGGMVAASGLTEPGWTGELNLDPRLRAAAALGADFVQRNQDALVADAWRQLGDIRRANRERDVAALAGLVTNRLVARHVQPLTPESALSVTAPVLARQKAGDATALAAVASSALPTAVLAPAFRRLAVTKGRAGPDAQAAFVARMSTRTPPQGALPPAPPQLLTVARARPRLGAVPHPPIGVVHPPIGVVHPPTVPAQPSVGHPQPSVGPAHPPIGPAHPPAGSAQPPAGPAPAQRRAVVDAGIRQLALRTIRTIEVPLQRPLAIDAMSRSATSDLAGFDIAARRLAARLDLGDTGREVRPTAPLVGAIDVPWPLADGLVEMDARYLMAGVAPPPDTAGLLEINAGFVTAALVGANDELIHELTWRGAKVDRRATPLLRFFDRRGTAADAATDIAPVASWPANGSLASNFAFTGRAVILLRGELVRRFPHSVVHAAHAIREDPLRKPGPEVRLPLFRGAITDDTIFVGFDLTPDEMRGPDGLGWYVVITEQPAAPRFGLDEASEHQLKTWNDLAWNDVAVLQSYVTASARVPVPADPGGFVWNHDAAHMAGITYQRLVAIAIHAADMLPPPPPPTHL